MADRASQTSTIAGSVGIRVLPVLSGFGKALSSGTVTEGRKAGQQLGKAYGDAAQKAAGPSLQKLAADVGKARSAEADAAGRVRIAEAQLADARARGGHNTAAVVRAEEALAKATRGQEAAAAKARDASTAYTTAQQARKRADEDAAASSEKVTKRWSLFRKHADDADGSARRLGRGLGEAEKASDRLHNAASNALGGMRANLGALAAGAGMGAVVAGFQQTTQEAANLEQSVGAVDSVFKENAGQMHKWAESAATDVGLSKNEFNELGTLIGAQLKNGGMAMDELAPKTKQLVGMGADMASMFGGTTKEAVEALSSALKGESDPIERYGVSLSAAKVEAEAAAMGAKKVGKEYSQEAKQAAILSLITKQTADAQGNFAREADTASGKQERLNAKLKNAQAQMGGLLLPVRVFLIEGATKMLDWATKQGPALGRVTGALSPLVGLFKSSVGWVRDHAGALGIAAGAYLGLRTAVTVTTGAMRAQAAIGAAGGLLGFMRQAAAGTKTWAAGQWLLNTALKANPIGLVVTALTVLVAGLVTAYKTSDTFRRIVDGAWRAVKDSAAKTVSWFTGTAWPAITGFFTGVGRAATVFWKVVADAWSRVTSATSTAWQAVKETIQRAWNAVVTITREAGKILLGVAGAFLNLLLSLFGTDLNKLIRGVQLAWATIRENTTRTWNTITAFFRSFWAALTSLVARSLAAVRSVVSAAWSWISSTTTRIWNGIASFFRAFWDGQVRGWQRITGILKSVISAAWSWISSTTTRIWNGISSYLGGVFGSIGRRVSSAMSAWKKTLSDGWSSASAFAHRIWDGLVGYFGRLAGIMSGKISGIVSGMSAAWGRIKEAFEKPVRWVIEKVLNKLIGGWNAVMDKIDRGKHITPITFSTGGEVARPEAYAVRQGSRWAMPALAVGGVVPGWSPHDEADNIPALLTADEHVIRVRSARRMRREHPGALEYINEHGTLPPAYAAGGPVWPTTSRRLSGNYSGHSGIDIPVPIGTPIFAAGPGTVDYVGTGKGYGVAVFQSLPGGLRAVYGHTSRPLVRPGQHVNAGQTIALSGNTGRSTGPHLHFEVATGRFANPGNRPATLSWLGGAQLQGSGGGFSLNPLDLLRSFGGAATGWLVDQAGRVIDQIVGTFGDTGVTGMLTGMSRQMLEAIKGFLEQKATESSDYDEFSVAPAGVGAQRWSGVAAQALARAGAPASLLPLMLHRIQVESGGNPRAINLWDINARRGIPSKGLMQTIDPTFQRYRDPALPNDVYHPLANLTAAVRYTLARYGLAGIYRAWGGRKGYHEGGEVKPGPAIPSMLWDIAPGTTQVLPPGPSIAWNLTGGPETLRRVSGGKDQAPAHGVYIEKFETHNSDAGEVLDDLAFKVRSRQLAGKYRR